MHNVIHPVALPVVIGQNAYGENIFSGESIRKEPGDTITKKEWDEAGQTEEDIAALEEQGAVEAA